MSKILLVDNDTETRNTTSKLLNEFGYEIILAKNADEAIELTNQSLPDIVLIDATVIQDNRSKICKSLKFHTQTNDIQILLLTDKNSSPDEVLAGADGYITKPFSDNILIATINAHLRIKKLLDILYTNNSELAKSLYQLNVLYNTSSNFAGTLDKNKLIDIMNTGLEKSLKHTVGCTLLFNEPTPRLVINASKPLTAELLEKLKERIISNYLDFTGEEIEDLSAEKIQVKINERPSESCLDTNILDNDYLFSSIDVGEKHFGAVEIIRETEFSGEDITCFQTVVKQVSLPLESAILYQEIKEKNIRLEKLEKLKSEFISIVSHELRTPLTSIKNSLDIILSKRAGEITAIQDNFLTMAKRNVDRLSSIINDLLDLSKIEAGKMDYRFEKMDILEPLNLVMSTFKPLADPKEITIIKDFPDSLPEIYGDSSRLEQVFANLISNAVKFTPQEGTITIKAQVVNAETIDCSLFYRDITVPNAKEPKQLSGDYIRINIEDSGIGISKEDIHKVFDKFQQIENSLTREVGGTGLGLAITKQLVEAHRGEIWVESIVGEGSKFCIILPIAEQENIFLLELDNKLQQSKYNYSSLALLTIKSNSDDGIEAMTMLTDMILNVFRKDDRTKILVEEDTIKVILANTTKSGAEKVINRVKEQIQDNKEIKKLNLSIGLAIYPDDAIESEELIEMSYKNTIPLI